MNINEILKSDYDLLCKDYKKATKKIEKQEQEIERLNKCYCERTDCGGRIKESRNYNSLFQENERLNNIINELEKHINSMCFGTIQEEEIMDNILNKLKELEGSDSE